MNIYIYIYPSQGCGNTLRVRVATIELGTSVTTIVATAAEDLAKFVITSHLLGPFVKQSTEQQPHRTPSSKTSCMIRMATSPKSQVLSHFVGSKALMWTLVQNGQGSFARRQTMSSQCKPYGNAMPRPPSYPLL